jgi:hypothetical protein
LTPYPWQKHSWGAKAFLGGKSIPGGQKHSWGKRIPEKNDKKKKRLQPWDNCKRLKFGDYLPHLGSRQTPFSGLTTWYLVAPLCLLQGRRH